MKKEFKLILPLLAIGLLAGCNDATHSSTSPHSSSSSLQISSTTTHISTDTTTVDDGSLDISVSFTKAQADVELAIETDWTYSYTGTYDSAIKIKTDEDFIETPKFNVKGKLQVTFEAFKTCGEQSDGKLTLAIEGINKEGNVSESVTLSDEDIPLDKAKLLKVTLSNPKNDIERVRISVKEPGKLTNVGIKNVQVKSVK